METPIIAEEAQEALDLSMNNSFPLQIPGTANNTAKTCLTNRESIFMFLEMGCTTLVAPVRQDCKKEIQFTFTELYCDPLAAGGMGQNDDQRNRHMKVRWYQEKRDIITMNGYDNWP
ncbi:hypothetical protein CHS0354_007083 [Potamilus streckersoni]|uniref:Uncharacterized protein n=1 Tax=Potamilus streckersoni TaxID=2493646 RepID=A0AAE0VMB0_9BIVA|nr:hypothetical protein CHS0354_007083 [Potamilus streckersoni]